MRRFISILIMTVMALSLFGCVKNGGETGRTDDPGVRPNDPDRVYVAPEPRQITVEDSDGTPVTTSADNAGIASLGYQATSLLIALGAKGNIVAVDDTYDDRPLILRALPGIKELARVSTGDGIDIEMLNAAGAGLVILTDQYAQYADEIRESGATVAVVRFETVEQVKDSARLIGKLSNTETQANDLASFYNAALERMDVMMSVEKPATVSVYADDPVIRELLGHLNCNFELDTARVVAKAGAPAPEDAIKAPDAIEPWDEPGVALVLGLYWYAHKLYPSVISKEEVVQKARTFYATYYGVDLTAEEIGIK